jgi:hypothetical protein
MVEVSKIKHAFDKGFNIDKEGNVTGIKGNRLKGSNDRGYIQFSMRINDKRVNIFAHRLQAYKKFGEDMFKDGIVVRHLDGNSVNNSWDNITIGTHSENMLDMPKDVRISKALHATSFVRKYDKEEVRSFYSECKSYKKTMDHFNITSKSTLHFILKKPVS